jgi:hypothetical protein
LFTDEERDDALEARPKELPRIEPADHWHPLVFA